MIQRKPDDRLIETFVGNHTSEALSEQKVQLALVQSASLLSLEGTTRANEEGNFYRLSIWREVKGILREWHESAA